LHCSPVFRQTVLDRGTRQSSYSGNMARLWERKKT
jgi:hypothetical protein